MITVKNFNFQDNSPINLYSQFGDIEQNQMFVTNYSQSGMVYVGDENVSPVNFGMVCLPGQSLLLPFMNFCINTNLSIVGDINTTASVMTWVSKVQWSFNENIS